MARYNTKKKQNKTVSKGRIYVTATFNNTIVSVSDDKGNVIAWSSTGSSGFKGSRKSTSYAANTAAENAINRAIAMGLKKADVYIKGPGPGRTVALRTLRSKGVEIETIVDQTPMPHNGTRSRKQRN